MIEKGQRLPAEVEPQSGQIARLGGVFNYERSRRRNTTFFVGWTDRGLPLVVEDESQLKPRALRNWQLAQEAHLPVQNVDYSQLRAYEYYLPGRAIDFSDKGKERAEDLLTFIMTNDQGNRVPIEFTERSVLKAILDAKNPWETTGQDIYSELVEEGRKTYSLVLPDKDDSRNGVVVIIKPFIKGDANEDEFKDLTGDVLRRLIALDERAPEANRKGYLDIVIQVLEGTGGISFYDFISEYFEIRPDLLSEYIKIDPRFKTKVKRGLARILNEYFQFDDKGTKTSTIDQDFPFENLDVNQLFEITKAMYRTANRYLRD